MKQAFHWYGYLYLLKCGEHYKIGFSNTPKRRLKQFRTGSPLPVLLVHTIKTAFYRQIEQQLHYKFAKKRVRGEWFTLDDADVEYIKSLNSMGWTPEEAAEREKNRTEEYAKSVAERNAAAIQEAQRAMSVVAAV